MTDDALHLLEGQLLALIAHELRVKRSHQSMMVSELSMAPPTYTFGGTPLTSMGAGVAFDLFTCDNYTLTGKRSTLFISIGFLITFQLMHFGFPKSVPYYLYRPGPTRLLHNKSFWYFTVLFLLNHRQLLVLLAWDWRAFAWQCSLDILHCTSRGPLIEVLTFYFHIIISFSWVGRFVIHHVFTSRSRLFLMRSHDLGNILWSNYSTWKVLRVHTLKSILGNGYSAFI